MSHEHKKTFRRSHEQSKSDGGAAPVEEKDLRPEEQKDFRQDEKLEAGARNLSEAEHKKAEPERTGQSEKSEEAEAPEKSKPAKTAETGRSAAEEKSAEPQDKADAGEAARYAKALADLENKEKELAEAQERYLRLAAEYENFRRRTRQEKSRCYEDAKADAVKALLPVLDNLDRAVESGEKASSEESKKMAEGMALVRKVAIESMEKIGVIEIPAAGESFDPELHNAVQHIEDKDLGENKVAQVLQKGYRCGDQVIRHSVVVVAN